MTDRELMQKALEALSAMLTHMGMDEDDWNKPTFNQCRKAEAALRERLAQPEQEPVAWMDSSWADPDTRGWPSESFKSAPIDGWTPLYTSPPASKPEQELVIDCPRCGHCCPQRKPLTREQINEEAQEVYGSSHCDDIKFARAIEAAHGIKENT